DVATHPSHQGKGAGSAVVRSLIDLARQSGCYKVILSCTDQNIAFYSRLGFRRHDNGMRIDLV
ncbi:MAG TPA: GNAT family N-acetyltransferase, partial [Gemmataceae bacterium]|nr:GNAT family N-acetyltransferase [Gemmataceae bacterium]